MTCLQGSIKEKAGRGALLLGSIAWRIFKKRFDIAITWHFGGDPFHNANWAYGCLKHVPIDRSPR